MSDDTKQSDPAPWWIKEMRAYGLAGFVLAATGFFGWTVYKDSRTQIEKQDKQIEQQQEKTSALIENNNKALWELTKAINDKK